MAYQQRLWLVVPENRIVDSLTIEWASGRVQTFENVKLNTRILLRESDTAGTFWQEPL